MELLKVNRGGLVCSRICNFPQFILWENDEGKFEGKWGMCNVGESAGP